MPTLAFDDVRDRYVTAPTMRRRRLVPLAAAAAVVAALAVGVASRRASPPSPLRAGKPSVTIPTNLLAEAMAVAPEEQRVALADGYVSADELGVAGEAMAACMTASGSGAPKEWEDLGNGARLPNKVNGGDEACERTHTLWLGWAFRVQLTLTGGIWADAVAAVFMNPDATSEQSAAVDALLHRLFPKGTIRFVDKTEAKTELTTLFPDSPDIANSTPLEELPTSFRIGGVTDLTPLEDARLQPGVNLVRTLPDALMHPPTGVPNDDATSTGSANTCPQLPRRGAATRLGAANTVQIDLGRRDGLATGMPVLSAEQLIVGQIGLVSETTATLIPLTATSTRIPAQSTRNAVAAVGFLQGNGAGAPLTLWLTDRTAIPQVGDVVGTVWDRASQLPGCIFIGQVTSVDLGSAADGPAVLVEPFGHLSIGQPVSVVLWSPDPATVPSPSA
jgi:hypothetical protein